MKRSIALLASSSLTHLPWLVVVFAMRDDIVAQRNKQEMRKLEQGMPSLMLEQPCAAKNPRPPRPADRRPAGYILILILRYAEFMLSYAECMLSYAELILSCAVVILSSAEFILSYANPMQNLF